jgi:hypothetical protein
MCNVAETYSVTKEWEACIRLFTEAEAVMRRAVGWGRADNHHSGDEAAREQLLRAAKQNYEINNSLKGIYAGLASAYESMGQLPRAVQMDKLALRLVGTYTLSQSRRTVLLAIQAMNGQRPQSLLCIHHAYVTYIYRKVYITRLSNGAALTTSTLPIY